MSEQMIGRVLGKYRIVEKLGDRLDRLWLENPGRSSALLDQAFAKLRAVAPAGPSTAAVPVSP